MKPTPKGWPRITSGLSYDDAARAIDWLCEVFGFEVRLKVEGDGGSIVHSELTYARDSSWWAHPARTSVRATCWARAQGAPAA